MRMDCHEIGDRMAAWLDAELSPGEAELFARHVEGCEACEGLLRRMEAQRFVRPALPDPEALGHWARLDAAVAAEWRRQELERPPALRAAPWWRRELRLPGLAAGAYAAVLLLALGLAGWQTARLTQAETAVAQAEALLQREQRLAARPGAALPVEPVGLVSHTPYRGSF